jgi:superfamily II DNA or RNA helicase
MQTWAPADSPIGQHIRERTRQCLAAYKENPLLVFEHANIERATAQGGYGRRQIYELVQNGADALLSTPGGRIEVILTESALYCANEGSPIDADGVDAIMSSHISMKRGAEIGRFGLGFKSVLGVTLQPEFFSRSGSFRFDAKAGEESIRNVVSGAEKIPNLRIAQPLDPSVAAEKDSVLATLMVWATTVVKLPLSGSDGGWLGEDIAIFPQEFLLFCSHVGQLIFEDRVRSLRRDIRLQRRDGRIALEEGENAGVWRLFKSVHIPSESARRDAGELADRESLPIMWAVPMQTRQVRGVFWAFFPTEYYTTLSGIVNAPWKTNEDRQNLLTGTFNEELITVAANLIAESLPELVDGVDSGRYLDLLPGRGREAPNWADAELTEQVYIQAARRPCLPDQTGSLRLPQEIKLHPAGLPWEALDLWASIPSRPVDWCHPSVETYQRRSRVERLISLGGGAAWPIAAWLEALVSGSSVEASIGALRVAALVLTNCPTMEEGIRTARILLTCDGTLVPPRPTAVFISTEDKTVNESLVLVDPLVATDAEGKNALSTLGIGQVDATSELQTLLTSFDIRNATTSDWELLWSLLGRVTPDSAMHVLSSRINQEDRSHLRLRTLAGTFEPIQQTLLPGSIVPEDGSRDSKCAIDLRFHANTTSLLRELGAVAAPAPSGTTVDGSWYPSYRSAAIAMVREVLRARRRRPQESYLQFDQSKTAGPLEPLTQLTNEGRARFTEALMLAALDEKDWELAHASRRDSYPVVNIEPPSVWLARREGRLRSSVGIREVGRCVGPALREWALFFPVADCTAEIAKRLKLPETLSHFSLEHWEEAMAQAQRVTDEKALGSFYVAASSIVSPPSDLCCRVRDSFCRRPAHEITVVSNSDEAATLAAMGLPFIVVSESNALVLAEKWGLQPAAKVVTVEISAVPSGPEIPLFDKFPGLQPYVGNALIGTRLVPCSSLRLETRTSFGKRTDDRQTLRDAEIIYFADRTSDAELLDQLPSVLQIDLSKETKLQILNYRSVIEKRERMRRVRLEPTLTSKLLAAVGVEAIRYRLPAGLEEAFRDVKGEVTDKRAAELALAVYGVETLHVFRDALQANGLNPPVMWAGSHSARVFVSSLGFPPEYAGFEQGRRDPTVEVDGPPNLPPLHAFQAQVTGEIRELVRKKAGRRGLLSLPTGAGKTRVAVEALIHAIKEDGLTGPILWVAQSDELCEQAVQTWMYVWRSVGPQSSLVINRLWASNEADAVTEGSQVVVATIQKLQHCFDDPVYEWLANATWLVIDEAHGSIEKSYTALLAWLGLGRGADRCPMLGLTATPFRGGEEDTERLVRRFSGRRLDREVLGGKPYQELQRMGVLARVDHEILEGVTIELTEKELADLQRTRLLPAAAGDRLGTNVSRNEMLLNSLRRLPDDWPILLFAVSVDHAQTMAALLSFEGISAAAISAHTEAGARRHYIEEFRRGRLRVLTNFAVLTAGFDAPSVRAIYVARPTYSPVMYQQMIGRGLRGPLNGGKERCLIVNVKDNIARFGEALAFTQFEYLWSESKND